MRIRTKRLNGLTGFLILITALSSAGLAQDRVNGPATGDPVPVQPGAAQPQNPTAAPPAINPEVAAQQAGPAAPPSSVPTSGRNFHVDPIVLPVDHLFGDWGGQRTGLEDQGFTTTLTFVSDMLGNPVGGKRRGFTEADNLGLNELVDLEKLLGLEGGSFLMSLSSRSGANLSAIDTGNTFTTQQVYGGNVFRVVDLAYLQKLLDDRVEIRVGRIATGDDFLVSPYDYIFVQNAFDGNPVGIFFNAPGMTAYPNSTWGAMLKVRPTDRTYVMGGLYNGDPSIREPNRHGVDMSLDGPIFAIAEAAYQANQLRGDSGLPGNYKAGIWYDGSAFPDLGAKVLGAAAPGLGIASRVQRGNYGFYGLVDQFFIRFGSSGEEILRGVGVTACVQAAPEQSISELPFFFTAGILARGIFPQRPRDVFALGIVYGQFSGNLRNAERQVQQLNPAAGVQSEETVLELSYVFRFRNGAFFFQPDMQYIIRPGGTGQIPNTLVVGCQMGFNF